MPGIFFSVSVARWSDGWRNSSTDSPASARSLRFFLPSPLASLTTPRLLRLVRLVHGRRGRRGVDADLGGIHVRALLDERVGRLGLVRRLVLGLGRVVHERRDIGGLRRLGFLVDR